MITIVYHQRLGDILQMLPAAKYLHDQGEEVLIECLPQYHGIGELITYAKMVNIGQGQGEKIDREIWPNKYVEYRSSKKSWMDFIYKDKRIAGADRNIVFDAWTPTKPPSLPQSYNLLAPHGISQGWYWSLHSIIDEARQRIGDYIILHAPPSIDCSVPSWTAGSITEMVNAIAFADQFMTINSSPAVIASAVRKNKPTFFFPQKNEWEQDNLSKWAGRIDIEG